MLSVIEVNNKLEELSKNIDKLNTLANAIDNISVKDDGSVYIKFNSNIVLTTAANVVIATEGDTVIKSNIIHLNPDITGNPGKKIIKEIIGVYKQPDITKLLTDNIKWSISKK